MRPSLLFVLIVVASFMGGVIVKSLAPSETVDNVPNVGRYAGLNEMSLHGIYVALPDNAKTFPEGLLALP
ncbi:MAG: hypothetical protein P8Y71_19855 [Pseudolabrys sp.]|jgi:hypothetical protein